MNSSDAEILDLLAQLSEEGKERVYRLIQKLLPPPKSEHAKELEWWKLRVEQWPTDQRLRAALIGATAKQHPCFLAGHRETDCPERAATKNKSSKRKSFGG